MKNFKMAAFMIFCAALVLAAAGQVSATAALPNAAQPCNNTSCHSIPSITSGELDGVYYTINGAVPTLNSTKYTDPIVLNKTMNIKYMVIANGNVRYGIVKHELTGNVTDRTFPVLLFDPMPVIQLADGTYYQMGNGNLTLYSAPIPLTGNMLVKYFKNNTTNSKMGIVKNTPMRLVKKYKFAKVKFKKRYKKLHRFRGRWMFTWRFTWIYRWVRVSYNELQPV